METPQGGAEKKRPGPRPARDTPRAGAPLGEGGSGGGPRRDAGSQMKNIGGGEFRVRASGGAGRDRGRRDGVCGMIWRTGRDGMLLWMGRSPFETLACRDPGEARIGDGESGVRPSKGSPSDVFEDQSLTPLLLQSLDLGTRD